VNKTPAVLTFQFNRGFLDLNLHEIHCQSIDESVIYRIGPEVLLPVELQVKKLPVVREFRSVAKRYSHPGPTWSLLPLHFTVRSSNKRSRPLELLASLDERSYFELGLTRRIAQVVTHLDALRLYRPDRSYDEASCILDPPDHACMEASAQFASGSASSDCFGYHQ
jgi:hypothetical protein